jgi:hypothetical protein
MLEMLLWCWNPGLQFKAPEEFSKVQYPWTAHMDHMRDTSPWMYTKLGAQILGDQEKNEYSDIRTGPWPNPRHEMFQRSLLLL